jgi:hypothetical protein
MRSLHVKVKPRSGRRELVEQPDGTWLARLCSPPVDGLANDELLTLVAETFGVRRRDVCLRSGAASRLKRVDIDEG